MKTAPQASRIRERTLIHMSRRRFMTTAAAMAAVPSIEGRRSSFAAASEVRFDFTRPFEGWETVSGKWAVETVAGASNGDRALVQSATNSAFNVIVAPGGPYSDVDVTTRFKPISGREDASVGIVFRFSEGRYYVIRANALENNFNFYYYDKGRHEISGTSVNAPALGQWHKLRVSAERDRIRGWLNDKPLIDQRDSRFASGRVGLWTKADSVTAFDDLVVRPL
ncbi:MAG: DUF1080 domain-containing protein [Pseudomonadota bacterium]|nr:DUF1080 domain-containing protein [Pseudomonadota bacterium]